MRIAVAVIVFGALTAPAIGYETIAEFDRSMQSRLFASRDDVLDFIPIQREARAGRVSEIDRTFSDACARFLERATADADALAFAHIICARQSSDVGTRIRHYEAALALSDAARGKAHLALAAEVEDGANARAHVEAAIAHNPEDPFPYLARGRMHRDANDLDAALRDVDRAIALAPGHPSDYAFRTELHWRSGRFEAAATDLAVVLEKADPAFTPSIRGLLKTMGVEPGTTGASLQESIAACMRGTPCGAHLIAWASLARPACAIQAPC